jgi:hypothetical protein
MGGTARDGGLDDVELALLRAIRFWDLAARHAGNRHALGMAAVDKVHLEQGGSTGDWHRLKRAMPVAMETLVVGGYLDDEAGVVTPLGTATLNR